MIKILDFVKISPTLLVLIMAASVSSANGTEMWGKKWSAGFYAGYAFSTGGWKESRYAEGVNRFNTDFSFALDISMKVSRDISIGFQTIYLNLDTDEWVDYVRSQGDGLWADAECWVTPLTLSHSVFRDNRNLVSILAGMGLAFSSGNESYMGITYETDFMRGADFTFVTGVDYNLVLKPPLALSLHGTLVFIPSGIHYADGEEHTIIAMPLVVGARFYF